MTKPPNPLDGALERVAEHRRLAAATSLPNLKALHERSAEAWTIEAERLARARNAVAANLEAKLDRDRARNAAANFGLAERATKAERNAILQRDLAGTATAHVDRVSHLQAADYWTREAERLHLEARQAGG